MSLNSEITRLESAFSDIREVISLAYGLNPDEHHDTYASKLSEMFVGNPSEHILTASRPTADGMPIISGIALIHDIKGNTIFDPETHQAFSVGAFDLYSLSETGDQLSKVSIDPTKALAPDGNPVFPFGLHGNEQARDVFGSMQDVRAYGSVALESLNWKPSSNSSVYPNLYNADVTKVMSDAQVGIASAVQNLITNRYIPTSYSLIGTSQYRTQYISLYKKSDGTITLTIQDRECISVNVLKQRLAGSSLFYQLATPVVVPHARRNFLYRVANGGTERVVSDSPLPPIPATIAYREAYTASQAISLISEASGL